MDQADAAALYERQVSYLQAVLNQYPDYLDALTAEERALFDRYFRPDWEAEGHFYRYYKRVMANDPQLQARANAILNKFMAANGLEEASVLPPPSDVFHRKDGRND